MTQLSGELEFRRPDDTAAHALISQSQVWVEDRLIHAVFARDISDRKRFEERLAYQARHDMLTGLPNRLAAMEHLDETLDRAQRLHRSVGVLFVDLDGFKAIDDGRGHAKGDEVLREVATRLRGRLRDSEFVGRLGGDEFLVVTEGLDVDALTALGERLVDAAGQPFLTDDELELHYQPIVDLRKGQAWGAEALVRWNRPGFGQLPPDRFIPVAERSKLIIDLGRWVINSALRTLAGWQRDPDRKHLNMAINISGRHLMEGDLIDDLRVALLETGADPNFLEVELTETHLLADLERANSVLRSLRAWGITVSVDDFGTGYSSMSYLRQLEIDTIKIDRVFVDRIQHAGYDRTIVEVLLQLASALDLDVVAEGVETAEQLAFLQDRNCGRVQGFHLARPMPLQQIDEWIGVWKLETSTHA